MKLKDKVAIVTGGARGIGAAMVERYVAEGANVAVADIAFADAQKTAALHGDKAFAVAIDVTKIASIEAAVDAVVKRWGGIDILVNNAGVFDMGPIVEVTEASWDKLFAVNTKGLFFTLQAVAKRMIAQGRGGKIINFSSQAGRRGEAFGRGLLREQGDGHFAHPVGRASISSSIASTSTASRPAWSTRRCGTRSTVCSPSTSIAPSARRSGWSARRCPTAAWVCRTDYGGAAVFLASSDSDYVVAQTLNVDGGNWMS